MTIFEKFINPDLIGQMPLVEKIFMSLFLTVLGMILTFLILAIVSWVTVLLSKACRVKPIKENLSATAPSEGIIREDKALIVAIISAAIAACMGTTGSQLRIKKIKRTVDHTPQWGKVGRVEQLLEQGVRE